MNSEMSSKLQKKDGLANYFVCNQGNSMNFDFINFIR